LIFVTVGTHPQQFNRLLKKVDEYARDKIINNVFIQIGYSDYQPEFCEYSDFVGFNQFGELIKESDIVITHGGEGSIGNALMNGKKTIVVPRLKKYSEHTNDHQLQITNALEKQRRIIAVYDIELLGQAIKNAKSFKPGNNGQKSQIIDLIEEFINN
jgi:UDP-N-acetylglucosamine transferase subunit ALG13